MPILRFSDRQEFFNSNIRAESQNHFTDYTIFINNLSIVFNTEFDKVFIVIENTNDCLALHNINNGNEAVQSIYRFIENLKNNEDKIFVSGELIIVD